MSGVMAALPDITRFGEISSGTWRALGSRLREIGFEEARDRIAEIGGQVFPPMCRPLRRWHAARMKGPVSAALRAFFLQDPVGEPPLREALGGLDLGALEEAGVLLRDAAGGLRAALRLDLLEGILFVSDDLAHGGDAVMGAGSLTPALLRAALSAEGDDPGASHASALEIGCGAGVISLVLARRYGAVVGTDINPRAVTLAGVNAALNGVENAAFRCGDLYEPVGRARFDLVVSQPPFFPQPDGAPPAAYMYGGPRGDEIALRILAGLPERLAAHGRGLLIADLPVFPGDDLENRLRAAAGPDCNLLVLRAEGAGLDAFCVGDAAYAHPDFGPEFAEAAVRLREHVERLGVERVECVLSVLEVPRAFPGWTEGIEIADQGLDRRTVGSFLAAADLLSRGREALLGAHLRIREGLTLAERDGVTRVVPDAGLPLLEAVLDGPARRLADLVDGGRTVREAIRRCARESGWSAGEGEKVLLPTAERLLRAGVLDVA